MLELPNKESLTVECKSGQMNEATAYRAAFMTLDALAGTPRQSSGKSCVSRARNTAGARLSALRAAVMRRSGRNG